MEAFGYLLDLSTSTPATAATRAALLDAYRAMTALNQDRGEETATVSLGRMDRHGPTVVVAA